MGSQRVVRLNGTELNCVELEKGNERGRQKVASNLSSNLHDWVKCSLIYRDEKLWRHSSFVMETTSHSVIMNLRLLKILVEGLNGKMND